MLNLMLILALTQGCVKQSTTSKDGSEESLELLPFEKQLLEEEKASEKILNELGTIDKTSNQSEKKKKITKKQKENELDFPVENKTGKTIYAVCFSYIKKIRTNRWRWDKSKIYEIKNNEIKRIDIDTIPDAQDKKEVYGYLGVFNNYKQAAKSTYELLDDNKKIDLDLLYKLKDQTVQITVEKYGFKGDILDFDIVPTKGSEKKYPELDFVVENKTGKTLLVTCFVYELDDDSPVWRYDKTSIIKILPNSYGVINVDTIADAYKRNKPYEKSASYARVYMRGYLAVFDESEKDKIEHMTYELLPSKNKISIGRLAALKNKKIVLDVEKYGASGDFIEYNVQPIRRINFKKAFK